jgi:hypothetical protein
MAFRDCVGHRMAPAAGRGASQPTVSASVDFYVVGQGWQLCHVHIAGVSRDLAVGASG